MQAEDDEIISDQQTILDIMDAEFGVDTGATRPDHPSRPIRTLVNTGVGDYEVTNSESNGGGETTLVIRRLVLSRPS